MALKFKIGDIVILNSKGMKYLHNKKLGPFWKVTAVPEKHVSTYYQCVCQSDDYTTYMLAPDEIELADLKQLEKVIYNVTD